MQQDINVEDQQLQQSEEATTREHKSKEILLLGFITCKTLKVAKF